MTSCDLSTSSSGCPNGAADGDLSAALDVAVDAARAAGALLLAGLDSPTKQAVAKAHRHDPVTRYDRDADKMIIEMLRRRRPADGIRSEEGSLVASSSGGTWVVDPLDGTNNFLRGIPLFAVSIGLVDAAGPCAACVYDPCRDEMFAALRGRGTTLNGGIRTVSAHDTLDGAVIAIGGSTDPSRRSTLHTQVRPLLAAARSLRISGSAALDLAYVAVGRYDATWYLSLSDWDVAAGRLLVTEACGRVTALDGTPFKTAEEGILASNGRLHDIVGHAVGRVPRG